MRHLYVHAMNAPTPEAVERVRTGIQDIEARLIQVMGTEELAMIKAEKSGAPMVSYAKMRSGIPRPHTQQAEEVQ